MNWNPPVDVSYVNNSFPYNSAGSFINFFEGLAYEHVNFIFPDALHVQWSMYPCMHTSTYKFELSEPGSLSYYDYGDAHMLNDHAPAIDEYNRHTETSTPMTSEQTVDIRRQWEGNSSANMTANHVECLEQEQNDLIHAWGLDLAHRICAERPHEKIGVADAQSIERKVLPSYEIRAHQLTESHHLKGYNVLTSFTRVDLWFLFLAWMLPDDAKSFWGFLVVEILPISYCTLLFSSSSLMSSTAVTTRARFRSSRAYQRFVRSYKLLAS